MLPVTRCAWNGSVGAQRTQGADRCCQPNGTPIEPTRQGIFLHLSAVAQAHALPDYPELELSNNLAENSMRPVAIGRRNWTHIGHEKAGPRVAAILSIVETCRRLKIPAREYLAAVLPGLANLSIQRLPELTPTAWAASNL
jgi:hypothetical protein